ncbi:hypothetical protein Tco_0847809 [Tanacetum coccineum]
MSFWIPGQMTYPVASLTLDSARSYVMQGAPFTKRSISSIPIGGSISPEGFLPSILLIDVHIFPFLLQEFLLVRCSYWDCQYLQQHYQQLVAGGAADVDDTTEILEFKTSRDRYRDNEMIILHKQSELISSWDCVHFPVVALGSNRDLRMVINRKSQISLGCEISSGGNKSQESNIGDSDNIGDGDIIVGGAIRA